MQSRHPDNYPFDRGVFTLSIDFELIWGTLDKRGPEGFRKVCETERHIIGRLLDLLEEFDISATWCVLGHLFLERCHAIDGRPHPEIVRPRHAWLSEEWFKHDPCSTEMDSPLFYGRSLLSRIVSCRVAQEVGSHSFSHVIFGDEGCSRATAESEIATCVRLAEEVGIQLRAFAYPRNSVGYTNVLREHGFTSYRGPEAHWLEGKRVPHFVMRLARLFDVLIAAEPPVVLPEQVEEGLWNIAGSAMYFPMHGLRRFIPLRLRVARARTGLDAAVTQHKIFHLWFHPTNLAEHSDAMFAGLREILAYACSMRENRQLDIVTLSSLVPTV